MEIHKLRVFDNRMLRKIFRPMSKEMVGDSRKLHKKELYNVYASLNIVRVNKSRIKWVGHVACMGEVRNAYKILVGKSEEKRPLGRPKHRWKDNIRMDLREIGWMGVDLMHLVQDRNQWWSLVKVVMNFWIP
jgi:hypothetical protein